MRKRKTKSRRNKNLSTILKILGFICILVLLLLLIFLKKTAHRQLTQKTKTPISKQQQNIKPNTLKWTKQEKTVKIPILMYHAIHEMAPEEASNANLILAPRVFESHIKRLSEEGYYFLSPEEAYQAFTQNSLPSKKVIWLTFDDSLIDFYSIAYPILKKYHAKATNNVITSFTDEKRPSNLSLKQMREMKKNGMSFQSHTVTHPDLAVSDPQTQMKELKQSKDYLDKSLNQDTYAIAYPAGRYNATTITLAKSYKLGVTTHEGLASVDNGLLSLNRVRILPSTNADLLMNSISSAVSE
ncbi:polysaccharide deacetylase family protein [Streptococcus macacae]|uniref:Polysaccharide deacetylase n=1 Tax=Streptococcus macacae NCTC 11558 TaxID=764298 RepID=G5JU60_9STRE|nr:polysaccharide deacetylase family protein [Streptococcus macacae]EHJ53137.1 polysaccharide deacetylase [Streptococcus macacae NCTC 11558]SUN78425.1 putative deacetylase [Streptococcus macacae NCTC 11558]